MSVSSGGARRLPGHRTRLQQQISSGRHQQRAGSPRIGQRSQSLSALQPASAVVIQPRMAQLETLEAKMASIEVSLSSASPRRKKCMPLGSASPRITTTAITTTTAATPAPTLPMEQLEGLRNKERHEARLVRLQHDTETKRHTIRALKLALEQLDITDNIDVRIQQAELEYQVGREELNLLTLLEETRAAQEAAAGGPEARGSVHELVSAMGGCARLLALAVRWSGAEPHFGAGVRPDGGGIFVEWTDRGTGLKPGDRLVEINGKLLITRTPPSAADLMRLFALCPDPARLLVLRAGGPSQDAVVPSEVSSLRCELHLVRDRAEEAQRAKDGLRADNLRLTHRISYLEEQVSELLESRRHRHHHRCHQQQQQLQEQPVRVVTAATSSQNVTNINIGSGDVQVFQKGPQVTALLPHRRTDVRSVKSLELDSDSYTSPRPRKSVDYTSEPLAPSLQLRKRPTPPKKPVRLSLHRAQSLQSVEPLVQSPVVAETTRKRSREKTISGLRWPQTQQQHKQTARWC